MKIRCAQTVPFAGDRDIPVEGDRVEDISKGLFTGTRGVVVAKLGARVRIRWDSGMESSSFWTQVKILR